MKPALKKSWLPYLALALGILALIISPMLARWANAPGPVIGFYRMGIAAIILFPVFLRENRAAKPGQKRSYRYAILGGLSNAFDLSLWYTAIHYTKVANATLMNNTAPLWVALVAWLFFKERLRGRFWIGLLLTLGGAGVVLGSDFLFHPSLNLGNIMSVASGFFYASYYLATQRGRESLGTTEYIWVMTLTSCLTMLAISLIFGMPLSGFDLQTYLAFLGAALVAQLIGFYAIAYALGQLPASLVSPTVLIQPVLTAILAIPLMGENLSPAQWAGALVALGGIYLINHSHETRQTKPMVADPQPSARE